MPRARDIPNLISLARIALVPPVVLMLLRGEYRLALWLFLIAGISDALDGFLAKRFAWESEFGGKLDPAADKLLLVSCFLTLGWVGLLPWWLVALVLLRDVVIVIGWIAYNRRIQRIRARPMAISKFNTFAQILLVLLVVADQLAPLLSPAWLRGLQWVVALTTVASGLAYVRYWGRKALHHD